MAGYSAACAQSLQLKGKSMPAREAFDTRLTKRENPDSIRSSPGGLFGDDILICGHIDTISKSPRSLDLYQKFAQIVTKRFQRIGSYRVGPEAEKLTDEGFRLLTISIKSPREYDVRRR